MEIKIEGMMCEHCVKRVRNALNGINAKDIKVDLKNGKATFEGINRDLAVQTINDIGYLAK